MSVGLFSLWGYFIWKQLTARSVDYQTYWDTVCRKTDLRLFKSLLIKCTTAMLELKQVGIWDRNKKSSPCLPSHWLQFGRFLSGPLENFSLCVVTKIYMFYGIFLTGSWEISRHVCGDQNRYFEPKTRSFPHPNHVCLCLNLTTVWAQPCHNVYTEETKSCKKCTEMKQKCKVWIAKTNLDKLHKGEFFSTLKSIFSVPLEKIHDMY